MPADEEKILFVENLSKRIGQREIVTDLTFDVEHGEIYGFLGPNGAGKTTTIRMLVGLIRPTRGKYKSAATTSEKNRYRHSDMWAVSWKIRRCIPI